MRSRLALVLTLATIEPVAAEEATTDAPDAAPRDEVRVKKQRRIRSRRAPDFSLGAWDGAVDTKVRTIGGALSGRVTLPASALIVGVGLEAKPAVEHEQWRLETPITFEHRETPGAKLRETRGGVDVVGRWRRGPGLRAEIETGLRAVWRPGWLDQYQPGPRGLMTTDRESHVDLRVGAALAGIPRRHQHVRLAARYSRVNQRDSPNFDPIDAPTHLVPGDHDQVAVDASWRYLADRWKIGTSLDVEYERWFQAYARDEGTGLTHAGLGGPPPNPRYRELSAEPALAGELELARGSFEIAPRLGYQIVSDRYQGYYSSTAYHPQLHLRWKQPSLSVALKFEAMFRTYGPNSYEPGPNHPPLDDGDTRRSDRKLQTACSARWALRKHVALLADAALVRRTTNYPDYVPGVFPDSRQYSIDWDYTNWEMLAGIELSR